MTEEEKTKYPEHAKLNKVHKKSQACGEFLEWLKSEKKYLFYIVHEHTDGCYVPAEHLLSKKQRVCGVSTGERVSAGYADTEKLLAEYFEIDTEKLDREKLAMLDEMRAKK